MNLETWEKLSFDEQINWRDDFLEQHPYSHQFGTFNVEINGRNHSSIILGSDGGHYVEFWRLIETGVLPEAFYFGTPEFQKSAKPLDFLIWFSLFTGGENYTFGYFVSKKAKEIMEKFNLGYHRFYPFTITKGNDKFEYFVLAMIGTQDAFIDYEKSTFYLDHGDFPDRPYEHIECKSLEAYNAFMDDRPDGSSESIEAQNLVFTSEFDASLSLFSTRLYIRSQIASTALLDAMEAAKLTGISIGRWARVQRAS